MAFSSGEPGMFDVKHAALDTVLRNATAVLDVIAADDSPTKEGSVRGIAALFIIVCAAACLAVVVTVCSSRRDGDQRGLCDGCFGK